MQSILGRKTRLLLIRFKRTHTGILSYVTDQENGRKLSLLRELHKVIKTLNLNPDLQP